MIKRECVLHRPFTADAYGLNEEVLIFKIRTAKDNLSECVFHFGDTACRKNPVEFFQGRMEKVASDQLFDYFQVELASPFKRVCYFFELKSPEETLFYYGNLFYRHVANDRSEFFKLPFNRREDIAAPPKWLKDAIVYNIFPDSFATGKNFISKTPKTLNLSGNVFKGKLGGTINGITENLSYITEMGFNTIYLNPIFMAGEYHKYDLVDYFSVDPVFGSNQDFKRLVDTCHKNSVKVIIDGVFNHCGWNFPPFLDVVEKGENSKFVNWFYHLNFPVVKPKNPEAYPNYECFAYERMMPKLNTSNEEVQDFLVSVGKHWIENYDIDGWRMDVADEINHDFWRVFRKEIKKIKADCAIIGEVWQSAEHFLKGDMFDSTMNYDFRKHALLFFAKGEISATEFAGRAVDMVLRYKKQMVFSQLNLLDSHDVPRFLSSCGGDIDKHLLSLVFLMTFCGVPSVFYGDEQGIMGEKEEDYRSPMIFAPPNTTANALKELITLRKENEALRSGDFRILYAQENGGLFAFNRTHKGESGKECVKVVLNAGETQEKLTTDMLKGQVLFEKGLVNDGLKGYGFAIIKE